MTRTALWIRCEADEADRIRVEAQKEQRIISGYVLSIALRAVAADSLNYYRHSTGLRTVVSRSTVLVRCTVSEAEQIRRAARRCAMAINAFILGMVARFGLLSVRLRPTEIRTSINPLGPTKHWLFGATPRPFRHVTDVVYGGRAR